MLMCMCVYQGTTPSVGPQVLWCSFFFFETESLTALELASRLVWLARGSEPACLCLPGAGETNVTFSKIK